MLVTVEKPFAGSRIQGCGGLYRLQIAARLRLRQHHRSICFAAGKERQEMFALLLIAKTIDGLGN